MPTVTVKIQNLPQIRAAFALVPVRMAKSLNKAIQKSIFAIERQSKINSPVLTGRLRASHETSFGALRGEVGPTVDYAIYVHEGTRFMRGRPFLFNAVEQEERAVQGYFVDAVREVLDDTAKL